jgi:hypothetical protein
VGKHVIRTSDRGTFRQCRVLWNWSSKIRRNLEPEARYAPFEDGTIWHGSLDTYYDPRTWHLMSDGQTAESVRHAARERLASEHATAIKEAKAFHGGELPVEMEQDYAERFETLRGMLEHYFLWAPKHDRFKPLHTEVEFEVPVLTPQGQPAYCLHIHEGGSWPIVYQGRLDGIVEDYQGWYWIKEHKTTGQMGRTDHLELDPQCGSYAWAIQQMLGIRIAGIIYTQALKAAPKPPQRLVNSREGRNFSVNRQQRTTYELYKGHIEAEGEYVPNYQEYLDYLQDQGNPFFRRIEVHRNEHSLEYVGRMIYEEAMDMLHDPRIYPNPSYFNCNGCRFREPCISEQNGYDTEFLLSEMFVERSN